MEKDVHSLHYRLPPGDWSSFAESSQSFAFRSSVVRKANVARIPALSSVAVCRVHHLGRHLPDGDQPFVHYLAQNQDVPVFPLVALVHYPMGAVPGPGVHPGGHVFPGSDPFEMGKAALLVEQALSWNPMPGGLQDGDHAPLNRSFGENGDVGCSHRLQSSLLCECASASADRGDGLRMAKGRTVRHDRASDGGIGLDQCFLDLGVVVQDARVCVWNGVLLCDGRALAAPIPCDGENESVNESANESDGDDVSSHDDGGDGDDDGGQKSGSESENREDGFDPPLRHGIIVGVQGCLAARQRRVESKKMDRRSGPKDTATSCPRKYSVP